SVQVLHVHDDADYDQDKEIGKEQDRGEFRELRDAEDESGDDHVPRRRLLQAFQEEVGGQNHSESAADIGGHVMAVGQDGRRKSEQESRQQPPAVSQELPAPKVNEDDEQQGQEYRHDACYLD